MTTDSPTGSRSGRMADIAHGIVETVASDVSKGVPADKAISRIFREHREYGSRDRRFYSDTVYSYFRWLGWTSVVSEDVKVRCALSTMLDTSVSDKTRDVWKSVCELSDELSDQLQSSDITEKCRCLNAYSGKDAITPADLIPQWVSNEISNPDHFARFSTSCQLRPPTWVPITESRIKAFEAFLKAQELTHRAHDTMTGAFAIESPFQLEKLERDWGRPIQVQDLASQAVVAICGAQPGEAWWDVCSGSGGKSLGLAEACGPEGNIIATDIRISILRNLKKRAKAHRYKKIQTRLADVTSDSLGPAKFDGVLADAPCSGLGTWARNPDARWRTEPENVNRLVQSQGEILEKASGHVKPGGKLVYSVCSVTDREGPGVVNSFLDKNLDFERLPVAHPLNGAMTDGSITIMPDEGPCDGMHITLMKKKQE